MEEQKEQVRCPGCEELRDKDKMKKIPPVKQPLCDVCRKAIQEDKG